MAATFVCRLWRPRCLLHPAFRKDFDPEGRFEIVTFEPNAVFAGCYSALPRHCLIQAAVSDRDGIQDFFSTAKTVMAAHFSETNSLEKQVASALWTPRIPPGPNVDLSGWIRQNTTIFDYLILKLDVEGAEYDILEKMIRDRTIRRLAHLFIEWHWDRVGVSARQTPEAAPFAPTSHRLPILDWDAQGY